MTLSEIMKHVDHTVLSVDCTEQDIKALIDDAIRLAPPRFAFRPPTCAWPMNMRAAA